MSIKNNKNNKNICLVLYIWKYGRQNYIIIYVCVLQQKLLISISNTVASYSKV